MTEVSGEVCDGLICHGFTTERYLREVTLPAVERGLERSGRTLDDFEISARSSSSRARTKTRSPRLVRAFASRSRSTDRHPRTAACSSCTGWGDLQGELNLLSKEGKWVEMGELIDDEILHTFAIVAEPADLAKAFQQRFGDVVSRLSFYAPYKAAPETWLPVIEELKSV